MFKVHADLNLKMNSHLKAHHLEWEQIRRAIQVDLEGIGSRLKENKGGMENYCYHLLRMTYIRRSLGVCFKDFKGFFGAQWE